MPGGWAAFWSRLPGAGALSVDDQERHAGQRSLKVVQTGEKDWSAAQAQNLSVKPGDIYALSGWVKCRDARQVELSVVTRAANSDTIDWDFGALATSGTHDWALFSRRFVVPAGCATIQVRLIGDGPGTIWLSEASLVRRGNVAAIQSGLAGKTLRVATPLLDVRLDAPTGALSVTDRRNQQTWRQKAMPNGVLVRAARIVAGRRIALDLWDVTDDLPLAATIDVSDTRPEISVTLHGVGAIQGDLSYPQPFVTGKGTALVLPLNEGMLVPVDDASVAPMWLPLYQGHGGLCMPWLGIVDSATGAGLMTLVQTPDDARLDMVRPLGGDLHAQPIWIASRGRFGYDRKLTYLFLNTGGYVAQAKRYRAYARQTGLFKTLAEKRRANPNIDRLLGAANVWNWDLDKVALCREMKGLGLDHVLWSNGGSPEEIAAINRLGYLTSRYDIYQDVWPKDAPDYLNKAGWPQDLVWLPNGDWMKGWADIQKHADGTQTVYQGGVICSERGVERAREVIPADLKTHAYGCRFLDTTTASPWRECYNPAHPLTRSQDRGYKMALLKFCAVDSKLVTGTETGIDPSAPYADYYEGMMSLAPFRLPKAGYEMVAYEKPTPDFLKYQVSPTYRIPLWELVYHECVVAGWYWGDGSNKAPEFWTQRDLFNILYGTPPMFVFDKVQWQSEKARFVASYKNVCPLVRKLATTEMLSQSFLTPDHTVERTDWADGTEIVVNFGAATYRLRDGRSVLPLGWLVGRHSHQ